MLCSRLFFERLHEVDWGCFFSSVVVGETGLNYVLDRLVLGNESTFLRGFVKLCLEDRVMNKFLSEAAKQ